jgi:CBS domain containing-hemolysin-like protein
MRFRSGLLLALMATVALVPGAAQASFLSGDALDTAATVLAWVVIFVAPVIAIGLFLVVHVLPEKIAEHNHHPQQGAIKTLCFLSLVFGGMLWPFAWLWAYSKPVMYKLAYGTDVDEHAHGEGASPASVAGAPEAAHEEMTRLRERLAELEAQARQEARG